MDQTVRPIAAAAARARKYARNRFASAPDLEAEEAVAVDAPIFAGSAGLKSASRLSAISAWPASDSSVAGVGSPMRLVRLAPESAASEADVTGRSPSTGFVDSASLMGRLWLSGFRSL